VNVNSRELQRARLGGVSLSRSALYPGHVVSWKFKPSGTDESVAILVPEATTEKITIIAYNLENIPVTGIMMAWDIEPGKWQVIEGIDNDGDDIPDKINYTHTAGLERTKDIELTFQPKKTTVVQLKLLSKAKTYWERPDLGIGKDDVIVGKNKIQVTVHSLGSVSAPEVKVALVNKDGSILAASLISELAAPLDFVPKTAEVTLTTPDGLSLKGCAVKIDPEEKLIEITKCNNIVIIH